MKETTVTPTRTLDLDLDTLVLAKGAHDSLADGACLLEAVSYVADEPWSDHPACVSLVIADFVRTWNDGLDDADRQMLKPLIPRLIGTAGTPEQETRRSWMALDWLVRTYLPAWLDLAGLDDIASSVRALHELVDASSWDAAAVMVRTARQMAAAAWAAAWAAADAARAAARAADDAVRAARAAWAARAARAAARAADDAVRAARAAWAAADAAADAARAADDAVRAARAAWAARAARAAWAAAQAAGDALRPTVVVLQGSAMGLVDSMIAVTEAA